MLDLQKLRMFVAAAHTRNFTRAAEQLDLTQPTVSQQIQTLERELGVQLFERLGRGIELTAAGRALLEPAEQMLALERAAEHAVRTAAGLHERTLHLGVGNTLATYILPDLLQRFGWEHPEFEVQIVTGNTDQLLDQVMSGQIELALVGSPLEHQQMRIVPFLRTELVVIVAPDDPWAERQSVALADLAGRRMLVREAGSALQAATADLFQAAGAAPAQRMVLGNLEAIKRSVEVGLGVALVPAMVVRREVAAGQLRQLVLEGARVVRVYNVIHHRDRHTTRAAAMFLALLQKPLGPGDDFTVF
ncbi:MAG TPA: LysR family transcriptional regulator [Herpetosiphonaceae bacterium]